MDFGEYSNNDIVEEGQDSVAVDEEETEVQPVQSTVMDYGLLIELIQGCPYLYDLSDRAYKDAKLKAKAWEQISDVLKCSVEECMKAWRNLRDRFVKEKNKLASGAEAPETNWPFFDMMLFYGKYTKPRKTYTSTKKSEVTKPQSRPPSRPSSSASVWSNVTLETLTSPESHSKIVSEDEMEENSLPSTSKETPGRDKMIPKQTKTSEKKQTLGETPTTSGTDQRKRKRVAEEPKMDELMGIAQSIVHRFDQRQAKNANSAFAEYIYHELEKLPENEARKKRKEILLTLFDDI